jgi:hypothetical protein
VVIDLNESRIKHPNQIIKLIRFNTNTQFPGLVNTLKATLAVIGLHLTRYLHGSGHPAGCEDVVSALSPSAQQEISRLEPSVLRATLLLRAISDYEFVPMDLSFYLTVSGKEIRLQLVCLT